MGYFHPLLQFGGGRYALNAFLAIIFRRENTSLTFLFLIKDNREKHLTEKRNRVILMHRCLHVSVKNHKGEIYEQ